MELKVERLTERRLLETDPDWWRIYDESFSAAFRVPREGVLRDFDHPRAVFLVARADERIVGIASLQMLDGVAAVFLGYFAVDKCIRGQGVGARLLEAAIHCGSETMRASGVEPLGMVLESELPGGPGLESSLRLYQRCGFQVLPVSYEQPPLVVNQPLPMRLLFRPAYAGLRLHPASILSLIEAIYEQNYAVSYQVDRKVLVELWRRSAASIGFEVSQAIEMLPKTS